VWEVCLSAHDAAIGQEVLRGIQGRVSIRRGSPQHALLFINGGGLRRLRRRRGERQIGRLLRGGLVLRGGLPLPDRLP
jgi:hypothetical protein